MSAPLDEVKGWFAKAESDLKAAHLLTESLGPYDVACFHCQQAVEMCMKGFLVLRGEDFPFTHDLSRLAVLCRKADVTLDLRQPEIVDLTAYAAKGRYDRMFWPSAEETRSALELAQQIRDRIRSLIPSSALP